LPLGTGGEERESVSELLWRRHHLRHNPQEGIDPFTKVRTEIAELIVEKKGLVEKIAASLAELRGDKNAKVRRREWFERPSGSPFALWWVPEGHEPTVAEAVARLQHLHEHGPSAEAFTFGEAFSAPDAQGAGAALSFKDSCPA